MWVIGGRGAESRLAMGLGLRTATQPQRVCSYTNTIQAGRTASTWLIGAPSPGASA